MIGQRMKWEDIRREYPVKFVVLKDVVYGDDGSIASGVVFCILDVTTSIQVLENISKDNNELHVFSTCTVQHYRECLKYAGSPHSGMKYVI